MVQKQETSKWCKLNSSETKQTLLIWSHLASFLVSFSLPFIYLTPPFQPTPAPSLCALTQSRSGGVMSSIWLTEYLSYQGEKKTSLKTSQCSGVNCSRSFTPPPPPLSLFQVTHVLNVAFGVDNLFPGQLVYKTLRILDLPDTDITSYFEECSSFIDQARQQVPTQPKLAQWIIIKKTPFIHTVMLPKVVHWKTDRQK